MCTSFVHRRGDVLIGMNFDMYDMPWSLSTKTPGLFAVLVDAGFGKSISFGVNAAGAFANNLFVDSNGRGMYKRASKTRTHTSRLVADVLSGAIPQETWDAYLSEIEVVNGPNTSCHNLLVNHRGDAFVVEPGRGVLQSKREESPFFVMANCSLYDAQQTGCITGDGEARHRRAEALLQEPGTLDVPGAFAILQAVQQSEGDWLTRFSMVYTQTENAVYYCTERDFKNIEKYDLN